MRVSVSRFFPLILACCIGVAPSALRAGEAEGRSPEALYEAALAHESGKGKERDPARAMSLFHAAADADHVPAMLALYRHYNGGYMVGQDRAAACMWLVLAREKGGDVTAGYTAKAYAALRKSLTPEEKAEADAMLAAWRQNGGRK